MVSSQRRQGSGQKLKYEHLHLNSLLWRSSTGTYKNTAMGKVSYRIYLLYRIEKYNHSIMANTVMIWMETWANWQMLSHLSWWIWIYLSQRSSVSFHLPKRFNATLSYKHNPESNYNIYIFIYIIIIYIIYYLIYIQMS